MEEGSVASICSRATDMYRPQYRSEQPDAISFGRSGFAPPWILPQSARIGRWTILGTVSPGDLRPLRIPERELSARPVETRRLRNPAAPDKSGDPSILA